MYNWVTLLCIRDWHNIVNQLYFYFKKTVLFIVTSKSIKYRGINLTKDNVGLEMLIVTNILHEWLWQLYKVVEVIIPQLYMIMANVFSS